MELTEDKILGGRLLLRQPARGYRINVDTILLAAAVEPGPRLMEAGCGVGAASLAVAWRAPECVVTAVERAAEFAALATANALANGLGDRVRVETGDALSAALPLGTFDGVFFNPPFAQPHEGRAPSEARLAAHVTEAPIAAWIGALAQRLTGGAALTLIHRADKLAEILAGLEGRLGGAEVFPVRPFGDQPAHRVLVRARKGSRAPLRLLKGLDLHDRSAAKHTPEAEAILRGDAEIVWS